MPKTLNNSLVYGVLITILAIATPKPAQSQILPHVWGTVGVQDEDISYGVGARLAGIGVEVGTGEDGATGVDVLKFFGFPVISPYIGAGWYSGDENFAYSGGVQLNAGRSLILGGGYHSIRGANGQIGFRF